MSCVRNEGESLQPFLVKVTPTAQRYLNIIEADKEGAESQNFAFTLLRNAQIPSTTFTNIVSGLVKSGSTQYQQFFATVGLSERRIKQLLEIFQALSKGDNAVAIDVGKCVIAVTMAKENAHSMRQNHDNGFISLSSATTSVESAAIEESDLQKWDAPTGNDELTSLLGGNRDYPRVDPNRVPQIPSYSGDRRGGYDRYHNNGITTTGRKCDTPRDHQRTREYMKIVSICNATSGNIPAMGSKVIVVDSQVIIELNMITRVVLREWVTTVSNVFNKGFG